MKFLYASYGKAGLDCLYQLLNQKECESGNIFVITYSDAGNRTLIEHLEALRIPYTTASITDKKTIKRINEFSPDYMFSIYFRDIVKNEILGIVKKASVNLHPSLLPDYKGCFSTPWVLINGEEKTGITYHIMDEGVDTGDIIVQKELEIKESDNAFSLYHRLIALGVESFPVMFQSLVRESSRGTPQKAGGRRYKREVPYGGYFILDWGKERIHNFIRAMDFPPYPGAKIKYHDKEFEFKTVNEFEQFCLKNRID